MAIMMKNNLKIKIKENKNNNNSKKAKRNRHRILTKRNNHNPKKINHEYSYGLFKIGAFQIFYNILIYILF